MSLPRNLVQGLTCAFACAVVSLHVGCRSTASKPKLLSSTHEPVSRTVHKFSSRQVSHQVADSDNQTVGLIPLTVEDDVENEELLEVEDTAQPSVPPLNGAVTLASLENILLSTHPSILKAQSELSALTGKQLQAGLPPNPNVGIISDDINADDGAGRYGVFYGQQVVRGNKLGLAQSVVSSELDVAGNKLDATRQKLLIDLRQRYYNVLLAQESVRQTQELVEVLRKSAQISGKLFEAEEIAKAPVLRSQVELRSAEMMVRQAHNRRTSALRSLASLLGDTEVKLESLAGDVRDIPAMDDFEFAFDRMLENHPELSGKLASVEQARRQLAQQSAVPIPNVTWQTTLQYDFTTDEVVGGFQVGLPIPRNNRNQGAIFQARQNVETSLHAADQKVLELRDRLTNAWSSYVDARIQLESLDMELLPKAAEALELASEGYRQGETPYLELLSAQQLFAKTKLGYLQKLQQRWQFHVEIEGLISKFDHAR